MNVHPLTAAYRALNFVLKDAFIANALSNAAQDGEAQLFLSATLAQTFNKRSSALTGAAITDPALAEPFIAAGAAVAFWSFFATTKGLSPRGYQRENIKITRLYVTTAASMRVQSINQSHRTR